MQKYIFVMILIIHLAISSNAQSSGWLIQSSPTTNNLYAVAFVDINTWITVGASGTILRSIDSGTHWSIITSPVTDDLRGVAFQGNIGLAVGISGRVLRTTDGGLSWIEEPRPTSKNLYSVSMSNYMVVITGEEGTILTSYDDGMTWAPHTAGTASILFGVSVNDSTAVGVGGQGAVVMSTDGGSGWGLTVLGGQLTFFYSTSFLNGGIGWAVGSSATTGNVIIHSTDYGFVWSAQSSPTTEQLFGVSFPSVYSGCAVGGNGSIIQTSDGGNTWVNQISGTSQSLNSVSLADSSFGLVVGNGGTILRSTKSEVGFVNEMNDQNLFILYPNPAYNLVSFSFNHSFNNESRINIYNTSGTKVMSEMLKDFHQMVNVENLNSGLYFVEIQSNSGVIRQKLMITK